VDSRNLDPAIFAPRPRVSSRLFTHAIPMGCLLNVAIVLLVLAGLWGAGWLLAGLRFP
jgi:hypothetical protein